MQNALFVKEVGKPVKAGTRAIPTPGPNEVLIKVTATQLLPHDTYGRDFGLFISQHLPFVLGSNIVGIVSKLGPDVTRYALGDHIYGQGDPKAVVPNSSGLQQYAILRLDLSALVPAGFTDDQMATLPINAGTSFAALFHPEWLNFPPPFSAKTKTFDYSKEKLVILGAGTQCGKLAIQFAKIAGIGTIIAVASIGREAELKDLGATHVIDRHSNNVVAEVQKASGGAEGITHVYDCASWTYELVADLVATEKRSRIAILHHSKTVQTDLNSRGKKLAIVATVVGSQANFHGEENRMYWESLGSWVQEGKVRIPEYRTIEGLDEARVNEALDSYRDGRPVVQAIVHPDGVVAK
ncbi:chaperonin 10-like protein [Rhexocercosporidium sp. MPI-PUGE-AT-0058]|nr:chaperonin 10-like protein [Rhexocercosporidium sp. MPI-PUGE-AT-0058]